MYDVTYETSDASKFLFMAYVFSSTLLFGQLVLGIIISVYDEIVTFTSTAIYSTLAPLYRELNTSERSRIISDFMTINCVLLELHNKLEELSSEGACSEGRWRRVLEEQGGLASPSWTIGVAEHPLQAIPANLETRDTSHRKLQEESAAGSVEEEPFVDDLSCTQDAFSCSESKSIQPKLAQESLETIVEELPVEAPVYVEEYENSLSPPR